MTRVAELPDDPALLKRLLDRAHDALIERIKAEAAEQLEAQRQRLEAEKKAEIDAILRRFYGPKSERFDPRQLLLFGIQVDTMPLDESSVAEEAGEPLVDPPRPQPPQARPAAAARPPPAGRDRARPGRRREALPVLRRDAPPDRPGSQRAARIPARVVQGPPARPPHLRLQALRNHGGRAADPDSRQAAAADRQGAGRAGLAGLRDHQQARRPPAALPARTHLRASGRRDRPEHDVRLAPGGRRAGPAARRADGRPGEAVTRDPHRRDPRAGAGARHGAVPEGPDLDLHRRSSESVHCLPLHARPHPRRADELAGRLQGLFAGRRLRRLRRDLPQGRRDRGRVLGARAPQVLRREGDRRQAVGRRCWRWSASSTTSSDRRRT